MIFTTGRCGREQALIDLFGATFTASDGADEGRLVGDVVRGLLAQTPADDIRVFRAEADGEVLGAAIFSRLTYREDRHRAVLLSPMAVATAHQRRGIGRALITHALGALRTEGGELAMTYGDPAYYRRVGFLPITGDRARAPRPLSQPQGWIAQSLTDEPMPALRGTPACVPALDRAELW